MHPMSFLGCLCKDGSQPWPVAPIAHSVERVRRRNNATSRLHHPTNVCKASPHMFTTMTNLLVVKTRSSYNANIERPTLNTLKAITSMYHLKMKFPTEVGVGEVCGE